jgi:hypothetical protein
LRALGRSSHEGLCHFVPAARALGGNWATGRACRFFALNRRARFADWGEFGTGMTIMPDVEFRPERSDAARESGKTEHLRCGSRGSCRGSRSGSRRGRGGRLGLEPDRLRPPCPDPNLTLNLNLNHLPNLNHTLNLNLFSLPSCSSNYGAPTRPVTDFTQSVPPAVLPVLRIRT